MKKKIAHSMSLFVWLWLVLCVCVYIQVLLCILCMVNTFSLQSASLALTPMTSLFILLPPTLSSLPLSHLSLPLISLYPSLLFSHTPSCHFCPSLFYLLTICGYSTRPLQASCHLAQRWTAYHLTAILAGDINSTDANTGFPVAFVLIL